MEVYGGIWDWGHTLLCECLLVGEDALKVVGEIENLA